MLILAASALEKVAHIPGKIWINVAIGLLLFFAIVYVIREAAQMNKIWLGIILFVALTLIGFHWIYSRNEPRFLTPLVDKIAPFFPTAPSYGPKPAAKPHA